MQPSSLTAFVLLICAAVFVGTCAACDENNSCKACMATDKVKIAAANARRIDAFLQTKQCGKWGDLEFKTVAMTFEGNAGCRTRARHPFMGSKKPVCTVAEKLDLSVDEEISDEAESTVVDDAARDGQLECEPNGTMVFNRGNVDFPELDSLYEPTLFRPTAFSVDYNVVVGFEVVLSNRLYESGDTIPKYWCHKIKSAFLIVYDVVDEAGVSVLPESA